MYNRAIKSQILDKLFKGKAIIVVGPRQVGKTTLANGLIDESGYEKNIIKFNCDNPTDRDKLNNRDFEFLDSLVGDKKMIFIDEAQKVETIGQTIKLLVDCYKNTKQVIATGSSSINLLDKTQEPLTGRKIIFKLFPLSVSELYPAKDLLKISKELEMLLIYGSYPEVINAKSAGDKEDVLRELNSSYLYKDVFEFQEIKNSSILTSLLKALALQIGSEVSYNELANIVGIDKKTVERYIDLLEKNYIIFRLPPYAKNQRRTISKMRKVYFYDLGVRNSIINNYNLLADRADIGALFENFMIIERFKKQEYDKIYINNYFLRTYDGAEIDLIEERGGKTLGYEFKWKKRTVAKVKQLAGIDCKFITPENIKGFII
ncbi:MAG: ATP-binding protein [Patescibacteria group bacterium]|nr:ATP-binding protein [Patescibacteria group bacterium]